MDVARSAIRSGAGKVKIICLEKKHVPREKQFHYFKNEWTEIKSEDAGEFMPAWQWEVDEAVEENVEIIDAGATISFDIEGGRIVRARCQKVERIDVDPQGRLIPVLQDNTDFTVEADWVITAVGSTPDYSSLGGRPEMRDLLKEVPLSLTAPGEGVSIPVLSGGDFVNGPVSVIDGIAAGREAACHFYSELLGDPPINIRYQKRLVHQPWANYPDSLDKRARRKQNTDRFPSSNGPFSEVFLGFGEGVAREEADRCMRCDWPLVRESKVKRFLNSRRNV
jgi:NADPH-dependent glutamate synthase beta subunit-like oxidoreductase